jgi:16S rRNA processing protein RimM
MRIGQIVGAHGIRGQLKVQPQTEFLERFAVGTKILVGTQWYTIETSVVHKGRPLITVNGITTMSAAQALQWQFIDIEDSERPELEHDEFLLDDLINLKVVTVDGRELGEVDEVLNTPAHETLVIGDLMIPFVENFVKEVNFDTETITVELIPGMLDDEESV